MNRLILIGNGFDLAHGLKSSFKDFIEDYLKNAIDTFINNFVFKDSLLEIQFIRHYESITPKNLNGNAFSDIEKIEKSEYINVTYHSLILRNALIKIDRFNWVDLEIEFFKVLNKSRQSRKPHYPPSTTQPPTTREVNEQFQFIKDKFLEYLTKQLREDKLKSPDRALLNCFTQTIKPEEIKIKKGEAYGLSLGEPTPYKICFLNFNYTSLLKNYFDSIEIRNRQLIYIHGNLPNNHEKRVCGDPVFGFGDELDKRYVEFENDNNNELFKHIKSFEYLQTNNYDSLIRFIDDDDFQVHIYGHSCGLSDRTLLNQIFEHDNCKSIKIFYYKKPDGSDDFTEKIHEISRHFKDKVKFRNRVVNKDNSEPMSQPQ